MAHRTDPELSWHPEPELIGIRDPSVSRPALERLGQAAWTTALDYLYDEAFRRAMGEPAGYEELRRVYFGPAGQAGPAPVDPRSSASVLAEFRARLAPHQLNAWHPRTLSYFTPPPLLMSVVGELLAQVAQQGVDVWHAGPSAAFVEEEVVRWLCDLVGYGPGSFGLLTSGGVMANFMAMALARDVHLRRSLGSTRPPRGAALEGVRVYVSDQAHFSIGRALAELGFPDETLVVVRSDDRFRLHPGPVATAIAADRAAGLRPLCIAAVAGSTNTGSIDDVPGLAELARAEGLWYHVDAAYGAAIRFSARHADRLPGLELADSVTLDPHKWFYQAYDIGGLVIRDGTLLDETFSRRPEYYRGGGARARAHDAHADDALDFYRKGFEGTRRWRALKLWLSWTHVGSSGFGHLVDHDVDLAAYLAERIAASEDFEARPSDPQLSVVCFRHLPGGRRAPALHGHALDAHQDELQARLEASGEGWLSTTRLRGATWLRAGILNVQTARADIDLLLDELRRLAAHR